jgi:hypothetical protein
MKLALKFLLLLVHYVVVAVTCYYIGDLMSKDTSGAGIAPNAVFLICLIISIISHTSQFILSFKNKNTQL